MSEYDIQPGAAIWASYLINGDGSGLIAKEIELADQWLEDNNIAFVVDIEGDSYFSWLYGQYADPRFDPRMASDDANATYGGNLLDYVVERKDGEYDGQPDEMQEWHDFDPDC